MFVSLHSPTDKQLSRKDILLLVGAVLTSLVIYLGLSAATYRIGFPLDDSWIHQTYARNLALLGEWSFLPGELSSGSTSPLWTILLALGFVLHLSPYFWTYLLGGLLLFGISILVELILRRSASLYKPAYPWAGCLFALEWHLAWAAFSGMETSLHIFLVLFVVSILLTGSRNYLIAGIVVGVSVWVRPDGLTLLGPMCLAIFLTEQTGSDRMRGLLRLGFGFSVFFFPYLLFNLAISGAPMPNTFYAKQVEYLGWQSLPLGNRLLFFSLQFFQGVSLVLIPGFIQKIIRAVRERNWALLVVAAWMIGYIILYLLRLPVYQHGRYMMPALAVFILIGFLGFVEGLGFLHSRQIRLASRTYLSILVVALAISFAFGGYSYSKDVAFIESQMVDTARWVAINLPQSGKIAAHDIGALGYFGQHPIVDLAGLIEPEIVPMINDDRRLSDYMVAHDVQYLVAFSDWKPNLAFRGEKYFVASENADFQSEYGSMIVYGWSKP
ncbi:MAG: hypothetical protein NTW32_25160 [Chloroflexi bacterium]|nr:hypothetical protein [Chloroflexota bacterium]